MKTYYTDQLPMDCSEEECPFNYDTIQCKAIWINDNFYEKDCELSKCLSGRNKQRYSKCPLRLEE